MQSLSLDGSDKMEPQQAAGAHALADPVIDKAGLWPGAYFDRLEFNTQWPRLCAEIVRTEADTTEQTQFATASAETAVDTPPPLSCLAPLTVKRT